MSLLLIFEQLLNGVQLGLMLFLMAAGLTLIFGIMDFVNLTHGSLYMMGGFFAAYMQQATGSFLLAVLVGCIGVFLLGILMEALTLRRLYERSHLDHVLATFGLLLFFNELALILFGAEPVNLPKPQALTAPVLIFGINYSSYRLAITVVALAVAIGLFLMIARTRIGMLIRAGASNREMVVGLGVNIRWLYTLVFGLGAGLAALAGVMTTPLLSIQVGRANRS